MPLFLLSNQLPDNFDPSSVTEETIREIHALNDEAEAAGVRVFAGGLFPASHAKTVRAQPNGDVVITDGPYMEAKEHIGGFWILDCADMDEALAWARKAAKSCQVAGEVREFLPVPKEAAARAKRMWLESAGRNQQS
jgi:hypothetical protein